MKSLQVLLEHVGQYSEDFAATAIAIPTSVCTIKWLEVVISLTQNMLFALNAISFISLMNV